MDLIINERLPDEKRYCDVSEVKETPYQEINANHRHIVSFYSYSEQKYYRVKCFSFDEVEDAVVYPPLTLVK